MSPVAALNELLQLPPKSVNNAQRLTFLRRAFNASRSMIDATFVKV